MCGIIAAASNKSVGKLLVQGLYKMEYRGYDSAGIALHQNNNILFFVNKYFICQFIFMYRS